ncbi:MAG: hypothetical protein QXV55_01395 [Acidilobaceae archaeon]
MTEISLKTLSSLISTYGLVGLFVVIFFVNLVPVPGLSFAISTSYFVLASSGSSLSPSIILGPLVIGSAATTAKFIIFSTSRSVSQRFSSVKRKRKELAKVLQGKEYIIIIVTIITALTPLPDDAWYIPLGASGFSSKLFIFSVFVGKTLQAFITLVVGVFLGTSLSQLVSGGSIDLWRVFLGTVSTVALAMMITYVAMKIDWIRFTVVYAKKGLVEAVKDAFCQLIKV